MGTSGFILKKREDVEIHQLVHEVKAAADRAGLLAPIDPKFHVEYEDGKKRVCAIGSIANSFKIILGAQATPIDICSDGHGYEDYDWILEGGHLFNAVIFDRVDHCQRILLDFLYEYLKSNPEDYFYCGDEWYFTFDDIARIKEREFDMLWCYKDPNSKEDPLGRIEEDVTTDMDMFGSILRKRENVEIYQTIHEVKEAAGRAGLLSPIDPEFDVQDIPGEKIERAFGDIANTYEEISEAKSILINIWSDGDGSEDYDWILEEGHLIEAVRLEFIRWRERILLDFLYEYLKSNPEDYFLCGEYEWYFTFDDIARIKQREFDPLWCYKDPRLNEDPH